jgi:environmental stress-induced protein Ves
MINISRKLRTTKSEALTQDAEKSEIKRFNAGTQVSEAQREGEIKSFNAETRRRRGAEKSQIKRFNTRRRGKAKTGKATSNKQEKL